MTESRYKSNECQPPEKPAPQPFPPGDPEKCPKAPPPTKPTEPKPPECPAPPKNCCCPTTTTSTPDCLETAIEEQGKSIAKAEKAKLFKTELEGLLTKARTASQQYTQAKYDELLEKWQKADREIARLISTVVCTMPCWKCILECYICPPLYELHKSEALLYGGELPGTITNLYDLRFWRERDSAAKERTLARLSEVLKAWEKPAQTIEKTLGDNATLLALIRQENSAKSGAAIYDLFLKLIPRHLAIAPPPASPETTTWIAEEYTKFCECGEYPAETCCGPNTNETSFRERLTGPMPYLVNPGDYFKIICCLVSKHYAPAKEAAADAAAEYQAIDNLIKNTWTKVTNGLANFEKDVKNTLPTVVDCCGCEPEDDDESGKKTPQQQERRY